MASGAAVAILAGILLLTLGVSLLGLRRLRWILSRLSRLETAASEGVPSTAATLFRQIEALQALYADLRPEASLPPTRDFAASPDFLRALATHALTVHPRHMVECGSGVSTVVLARCAQINGSGHLYTLEHLADFAAATRGHLARHGLSAWATVLEAPLVPHALDGRRWSWYSLDQLPDGPIDLLVVDGPPAAVGPCARYPAGPLLFGRLGPAGVVFVDDAAREDEKRALKAWTEADPDLSLEILPLEKGCAVLRWRPGSQR